MPQVRFPFKRFGRLTPFFLFSNSVLTNPFKLFSTPINETSLSSVRAARKVSPNWSQKTMTCHSFNRPFPSSPRPLFQNEVRCSACDMEIIFHSHANKTHFHEEGCAPNLVLKQRRGGTRKNGLLFQYCLGSGLGTAGDFSSEQLLLTRGGNSHMKQTGMLVGNFEFDP